MAQTHISAPADNSHRVPAGGDDTNENPTNWYRLLTSAEANFNDLYANNPLNNFVATTNPLATSDSAAGYSVGSRWINTTTGRIWVCINSTANAAVWTPLRQNLLGALIGANMNVTTDQAIPLFIPAAQKFRVTKITALNASISLTTAAGGIYRAAAKAGTAMVANTQVYSALTAATLAVDLTLATATTVEPAAEALYLSLTTGQGSAATADLYVYGDIYL